MSAYNHSSRCPETGRLSRKRNRFHDNAAEQRYGQKLVVAKQLRKHGTRYSAEFMARNSTLRELQSKLRYIQGCIRSV